MKIFAVKIDTAEAEDKVKNLEQLLSQVGLNINTAKSKTTDTKTTADATIKEIKVKLDEVDRAVMTSKYVSFRTFTQITGLIRGLIHSFHGMLTPLQNALINALFACVEMLAAIATSQYSNPYTLAFAIATTAASVTLSIVGAAQVEQGMNEARQQTMTAQHLLNTVSSTIGGFL